MQFITFFGQVFLGVQFLNLKVNCFPFKHRMAGLGVRDPVSIASKAFLVSREGSSTFLAFWFDGLPFSVVDHREAFCRAREWAHQQPHQFDSSCMEELMESFHTMLFKGQLKESVQIG